MTEEQRPIFVPQPVVLPAPVEQEAEPEEAVLDEEIAEAPEEVSEEIIEQPEESISEESISEESTPEERTDEHITWIGAPEAADKKKASDGISDLFELDNEPDTDDLVSVDIEHDILDANEDGDLSDLTEVSEEDIMGDDLGQTSLNYKPRKTRRVRRIPPRYYPTGGMGGIRL